MQVIDAEGQEVDPTTVNWASSKFPYRLRQSTGCDNALGLLKLNLTGPYAIYLHDTNARQVSAKTDRYLSHGCVRVEKPESLANLLLGYPHFEADYLVNRALNVSPQTIPLPRPVPIIVTYNRVDVDEAGIIRTYPNVYGR